MGRLFTAASSEVIHSATTDLRGLKFTSGTMAMLLYKTSAGGSGDGMIGTNNDASDCNEWHFDGGDGNCVWDNAALRTMNTSVASNVNILIGWTKAPGTTTPRGHLYNYATNVWSHVNGAGGTEDTGPLLSIQLGAVTNTGAIPLDGEVWAVGMWQLRNMTDSEFQRLAGGRWLEQAPDFYEEWVSGRELGDMVRSLGRFPARQTSRIGSVRGHRRPPPGFRMSPQRRRR